MAIIALLELTGIVANMNLTTKPEEMKPKDVVKSNLEILLAVELLEYHDKNWLAWSNKKRNEEKRELIMSSLHHTHRLTNKPEQ